MALEIRHRFSNVILFSTETNLRGVDLCGVDLRGADLRGADLRGAYLRGADLRGADLYGADLYGADLRDTDLRDADLRDVDLYGAGLRGVDLRGANFSGAGLPEGFKIARLDFGGWSILVTHTKTSIGCQTHENTKWLKADPRWIEAMHPGATAWWTQHGAVIQALIHDVSGV